jgi:hypothetical protein
MIGKCQIKLKDLASGKTIDGDFPIIGQRGEERGKASVKITIVEPKSQKKLKSA